MDMGLDRLRGMILDMAQLSNSTVTTAIDAYEQGKDVRAKIFDWSEELRILQDEVSELAVELIARYQPVATDLRFIKSCMGFHVLEDTPTTSPMFWGCSGTYLGATRAPSIRLVTRRRA